MKQSFVTISIRAGALLGLLIMPLHGCTNLDETPVSVITPGTFFGNEAEVSAALAGVYAQLRSTAPEGTIYDANEVSTDEIVVPIRGPDWIDNGQWIDLHNQTWTPTSAAASNFFNGAWNNAYTGVARANLFISSVEPVTVPNKATYLAEGRALRAFYYYILMDFFGGVPIVTDPTDHTLHARNTRRELFDFIERELIAARDSGLPATWNAANNGRFTQGAADAILANMYLNAGVFTKDGAAGGISASAYNSCAGVAVSGGTACAEAIAAADRVLTSGHYALSDSFPKMFRADNANSPENIFVVKFINKDGLGFGIDMATLHYCMYSGASPWNGFATLAQTYAAFDPADKRRRVILIGPQVDVLTGAPATVRSGGSCPTTGGSPLVFTDTIGNISDASEGEGPRIYKWPADPAHVAQNSGNDYAWFRLGEIYLIKAEAQHVLGQDGPALTLLNTLRNRSGDPVAAALGAVSDSVILSERLFELFGESKRRQDLIRFGKYTGRTDAASGIVGGKVARPAYYVLFPIPQTQVNANPLLAQNPGY